MVAVLALAGAVLLWSPHRPASARLRRLYSVDGRRSGGQQWTRRLRGGIRRRAGPGGVAGAFDLLAACLTAGMPVPTAVRAVADQFPPHLARTLRETADLLALGAAPSLAWAGAVDCAELAQLARGARRSARSGTALADLARGLARQARDQLADAAEARAQRAGVLVAGPLALCFLPAFLCLGVAPVVIGLASTFF